MSMSFEFNNQLVPQSLVELPEIGDVAIEGSNDEGFFYYLVIRTILGTTAILTCGPVIPDVDMIPSGFKITYDTLDYKEDKISKTINYFLNDKSKMLTEAKVVDSDFALNQIPKLKEYIEKGLF